MGYLHLERYIQRTRKPLSSHRRINNKKVASEGREKFFNINVQFIIPRGWSTNFQPHLLLWMALSNLAIFSWIFKKICYNREQAEVVERQTRMLQAHVPVGCEGSNPFLRIRKNERVKWLSHFYFYPILIQIIPNSIIGLLLSKHRSSEQKLPSLALLLEHWPQDWLSLKHFQVLP